MLRKINLILLFLGVFLGSCTTQPGSPEVAKLAPEADSTFRVKLIFTGDIMGHSPQITSAWDEKLKAYNYKPCFQYVKPILSKADLAIGNLEVTLPGVGPYKGYPMFRSPDALADALKDAGFDIIVTSNNHSNDGGLVGITHTLDVLDSLDLLHTGTFRNQAERDATYPLIVKQKKGENNISLAFLNYTYDTNGLPTPSPAVVNLIKPDIIKADLKKTLAAKPDFIIAVMHWGAEYQLNEGVEQQAQAKLLLENGADIVIGMHPHVIQPVKEITVVLADKTQKTGIVAYSLGNYISNQQQANTDMGLMFEIVLEKNNKSKKTSLKDHAWIPVWRYIENKAGKVTYYTLPASAMELDTMNRAGLSSTDMTKMKTVLEKMRTHLKKYASKERMIKPEEIFPK